MSKKLCNIHTISKLVSQYKIFSSDVDTDIRVRLEKHCTEQTTGFGQEQARGLVYALMQLGMKHLCFFVSQMEDSELPGTVFETHTLYIYVS